MEKITCKTCKHSKSVSNPMVIGQNSLFCHLNPPTPMMMQGERGNIQFAGIWAPVIPDESCSRGEVRVEVQ
jgi:hypothetical protein